MSEQSISELATHIEGLSLKKQNIFCVNLIERLIGERNERRNELIEQSEEIRREIREIDESVNDLYSLILAIPGTPTSEHNELELGKTVAEFEVATMKKGVSLVSVSLDENQRVMEAVVEMQGRHIILDRAGKSAKSNLWN